MTEAFTQTRYLVELEEPELDYADVEELSSRSRSAAAALRARGAAVRFLRTIYVPQDGRCYLLWEGGSRADVLRALAHGRLAGSLSAALRATEVAQLHDEPAAPDDEGETP